MALGETHWNWTPAVGREVAAVLSHFSAVTANTYRGHPWQGWDGLSVDFWGPGGRGFRIREDLGWQLARFLLERPGKPLIRHIIYEHSIWTSWGGWCWWAADDHDDGLEHLHVTFWP